jgi:hypothetical protein
MEFYEGGLFLGIAIGTIIDYYRFFINDVECYH